MNPVVIYKIYFQVKDVMKHWRTTAETLETIKYLEIIKLGII